MHSPASPCGHPVLSLKEYEKNLVKQALFCHAEKSCKCKKKKESVAAFSGMHYMLSAANEDQQKGLLTSDTRIKHLKWTASKESRVDRFPGARPHF